MKGKTLEILLGVRLVGVACMQNEAPERREQATSKLTMTCKGRSSLSGEQPLLGLNAQCPQLCLVKNLPEELAAPKLE